MEAKRNRGLAFLLTAMDPYRREVRVRVMGSKRLFGRGLVLFGTFLSGCTITVDESLVFQPLDGPERVTDPELMSIQFEKVFMEPANFSLSGSINQDQAHFSRTKEEFVPVEVRHDLWADGTIAVTEFVTGVEDAPLVVHCGGNASDRYHFGTLFGLKVTPHADLLIFDYPGYGDSPGEPSAEAFEAMTRTSAGVLDEKQVGTDRSLVLWGYSLGGFVCARLAQQVSEADAIIIESSGKNAEGAARYLVPKLLRPFVRVRLAPSLASYDNAEALAGYEHPVLVLSGTEDGILPVELSRDLAA